MFIIDTGGPSDTIRILDTPETCHFKHYCRINNIALEFDLSWIVDLFETYEDLMKEASPCGFVSRIVYYQLHGSEPWLKVGLVDKDTEWLWDPKWCIHQGLRPGKIIDYPVDRSSDYDGGFMETNLVLRCKWCANDRSEIHDELHFMVL